MLTYEIDEEFLKQTGREHMPEKEKERFLAEVQEELEVRLGETLSNKLSEEEMDEYMAVLDGDSETIARVVGSNYENDDMYRFMRKNAGGEIDLIDYASAKWLLQHCPDYMFSINTIYQNLILDYSVRGER